MFYNANANRRPEELDNMTQAEFQKHMLREQAHPAPGFLSATMIILSIGAIIAQPWLLLVPVVWFLFKALRY